MYQIVKWRLSLWLLAAALIIIVINPFPAMLAILFDIAILIALRHFAMLEGAYRIRIFSLDRRRNR